MPLTEQIGMALLVLGLLGGLLWLAKRRGVAAFSGLAAFRMGTLRSGNGRRLEVLERVALTPQHALHLVRVSDRTVLIATAPSSCTLLDAPAAPEAPASSLSRDLLRSRP
jgi:flagellar biogenesis protein FliO